jgi:hypothetical protein
MTIFIKENSTLPKIKFPLKQWMREKLDITDDMMENVAVTFSMVDESNGVYRVANAEAGLEVLDCVYERLDEAKYTLFYTPKLKDTRKAGLYRGEFKLDFLGDNCGKITLPTDDTLQIVIGDSITKTTVV